MKVTIITPVLNGAATIEACIRSIGDQTYSDIEHIVVDGCSTDGTIGILERLGVNFISEPDVGLYDAFNKGVSKATGEVVHILNADDMYASPKAVENVIKEMVSKNLEICHGRIEQIDDRDKVVKVVGADVTKKQLLSKMKVAHPATFVRKSVYEKYGAFSVGFEIAADQEFLLRVWDHLNIGFIPDILVKMRLGGASNSQVEPSYRESLAAAIMHGANPGCAVVRFYWELIKNRFMS